MNSGVIADKGIVTLCDEHYFDGLLMLHRSVRESFPVPVACYDLGLTESQKVTAASLDHLLLLQLPDDPLLHRIRNVMGDAPALAKAHKRVWPLWICPILIREAPFRDVFWMDCDLVVLRNLSQLFAALEEGPVFTPENKAPALTPNKPRLYELLTIARSFDPQSPTVNAGVSGWRKDRDAAAINAYLLPVSRATEDVEVRSAISWHDQGALIWAIQHLGLEHRVFASNIWNLCVDNSPVAGRAIPWDESFLETLRGEVPDANVLHWNGSVPPWTTQTAYEPEPQRQTFTAPEKAGHVDAKTVENYYDKWTDRYLDVFGDTFQAMRPTNVNELHAFVMERAGLESGQRILDAGCGVCGPSRFFATALDIHVDAVTISGYQASVARKLLREKQLDSRVKVHCGNFENLGGLFAAESFDRVLFLESLIHATDPRSALLGAMHVLKPGGLVYIKDYFALDGETEEETKWLRTVQSRANEAFAMKITFFKNTLRTLLDIGFESPTAEPMGFENDNTVWFAFARAHQFDLYRGGEPVEWFEMLSIVARKPAESF